ncbi:MAG TPA: hypothetical protein VGE97_10200 [Nitrososphaera sp.]
MVLSRGKKTAREAGSLCVVRGTAIVAEAIVPHSGFSVLLTGATGKLPGARIVVNWHLS